MTNDIKLAGVIVLGAFFCVALISATIIKVEQVKARSDITQTRIQVNARTKLQRCIK